MEISHLWLRFQTGHGKKKKERERVKMKSLSMNHRRATIYQWDKAVLNTGRKVKTTGGPRDFTGIKA